MSCTLTRHYKGNEYTTGRLYIDGEYFCDTIEDIARDLPSICNDTPKGLNCQCKEKVYAETAIPAGTYKVAIEYSPRFKKFLPRLHDVPHFLGILIHSGNDQHDSSGCIIVGENKIKGKVINSRITLSRLIDRIKDERDITIEIV